MSLDFSENMKKAKLAPQIRPKTAVTHRKENLPASETNTLVRIMFCFKNVKRKTNKKQNKNKYTIKRTNSKFGSYAQCQLVNKHNHTGRERSQNSPRHQGSLEASAPSFRRKWNTVCTVLMSSALDSQAVPLSTSSHRQLQLG